MDYEAKEAAEMLAIEVLHHIDEMYPAIWESVPKAARTSVRNIIINKSTAALQQAVEEERDACEKLARWSPTISAAIRSRREGPY